jgi:hypothetical protein
VTEYHGEIDSFAWAGGGHRAAVRSVSFTPARSRFAVRDTLLTANSRTGA